MASSSTSTLSASPLLPTASELSSTAQSFLAFLSSEKGELSRQQMDLAKLRTVYNLEFKHNNNYSSNSKQQQQQIPVISFSDVYDYMVLTKLLPPLPAVSSASAAGVLTAPNRAEFNMKADKSSSILPVKKVPLSGYDMDALAFSSGFSRDVVTSHMERNEPAVLFTMATKLNPRINWNVFDIKGYTSFRQDIQNEENSGILVYVRNRLDVVMLDELESPNFEAIWLKLTHPDLTFNAAGDREPIVTVVGNVVRSGAMPIIDFYDYIKACVTKVRLRHPDANLLIQGHFNWQSAEEYHSMSRLQAQLGLTAHHKKIGNNNSIVVTYLRTVTLKDQPITEKGNDVLSTRVRRLGCSYCKEGFFMDKDLENHRRTLRHRRNYCYVSYHEKRSELIASKCGMHFSLLETGGAAGDSGVVNPDNGLFVVKAEPGQRVDIKFQIKNESEGEDKGVILKSVEVLLGGEEADGDVELSDGYGITKPVEKREEKLKPGVRVLPSRKFIFTVSFLKRDIGQYRVPIMAQMKAADKSAEGASLQHMVFELVMKIGSSDMAVLEPASPYEPPKPIRQKWRIDKDMAEPGLRVDFGGKRGPKESVPLEQYSISKELQKILNYGFKSDNRLSHLEQALLIKYKEMLDEGLTPANYCGRFKLLLHAEEHQMEFDIRNFDMEDVTMERDNHFMLLRVPGLAENRPSVLRGDNLYVHVSGRPKEVFQGFVHEVQETKLRLGFSDKFWKSFFPGTKYNVQFTFNRFPVRTMHRAVEMMKTPGLVSAVFPRSPKVVGSINGNNDPSTNFINRAIGQNEEQKMAVTHILSENLVGAPYIIFGPPGTGKTVTIVEAMKQLYKRNNNTRILACAPSNSAADLIAMRLLDTVAPSDILRLYARSRDRNAVPEGLVKISSFNERLACETVHDIMAFKVVVVTLVNAGRLVSLGVPRGHFHHIFLDEAGHAQEPEALIPLSGLLDPSSGHFVLTGDPKQLGPILRSPVALANGLQLSLLERIMTDNKLICYQKDLSTHHYDPTYITKLLNNFRSHSSLLSLPSKLFYESELRAKADPIMANSLLQWEGLPKKGFPMVFHSVVGVDERESRSPSFFNKEEVCIVVKYLQDLLEGQGKNKVAGKDIGVITPYRRQVQKIRDLMNNKFQKTKLDWRDVTVGSTEEFQGQERRVIIISTVRSKEQFLNSDIQHKLGFLKNPKRFNVAITRAKALMVVVGNPTLLQKDPNWKSLIDYAFENGGYTGSVKYVPKPADSDSCVDALEEKLRALGVGTSASADSEEEGGFEVITQMELQEAPEWRADF